MTDWRDMTWSDFCRWVQGKTVVDQAYDHETGAAVLLTFADGCKAALKSNYDGDYSEDTPGNGIEPPTVRVRP